MGDFGAKGSVKGYDVKSAVDYLLQFNSSWPLLKVHDTDVTSGTVTHNLNYFPFHIITTPTGQVNQSAGLGDNFGVSGTQLVRSSGSGSFRYFIFRLSLEDTFTAPIVPGGTSAGTIDSDYGYKVAKIGKSINSTDMRDFSLHSSTRSPALHKVDNDTMSNTGGGLGYERTVTHGLTYTPVVFVFIKPSINTLGLNVDRYCIVPPPTGVAGIYFTVSATSVYVTADSFSFSSAPTVSVVVLKDPLAKEAVNITYP